MIMRLMSALTDPLWKSHKIGDEYFMDGKGTWKISYYPLLQDGKTDEEYTEPRALVEMETKFENVPGTDFREVPLRYLKRK